MLFIGALCPRVDTGTTTQDAGNRQASVRAAAAYILGSPPPHGSRMELRISTDRAELDVPLIHRFLSEQTYWAKDIPLALVQKSIEHSLCFGGYVGGAQVAFARVVSDFATFANLVDVFVLPEHRGKGYSKALTVAVLAHPQLQGLRRFTLATGDAHGLYAQFGFTAPLYPQTLMERYFPGLYTAALQQQEQEATPEPARHAGLS
jgi:GNAT superfamily N-acetyltransferase